MAKARVTLIFHLKKQKKKKTKKKEQEIKKEDENKIQLVVFHSIPYLS